MTDDAEIEERHREPMRKLARLIDGALNPDGKKTNGFFLAVYTHGEVPESHFNYISNSRREDVIVLLKEMLARFEGQPEVSGRA